jgi:hypothetical protein
MAFDQHKNLASSTVATAPGPPGTGLSLTVAAGQGARFPSGAFDATVWPVGATPSLANAEIVRVLSVAADTFTLGARATGGTTARAIVVGDLIAETITARSLEDIETQAALLAAPNTFTGAYQILETANPLVAFIDTSVGANLKRFDLVNTAQNFIIRPMNDAGVPLLNTFVLYRNGGLVLAGDLYEKARATPIGHWINVPSNGGNFSVLGGGGVSLTTYFNQAYTLVGKTMTYAIYLSLTVTGTPNAIKIALPAGVVTTNYAGGAFFCGAAAGMMAVLLTDTFLYLYVNASGSATWTAGTYTCVGTLTFQIT